MTNATLRVALVAIREVLSIGGKDVAEALLDELISALDGSHQEPSRLTKTESQKRADRRARAAAKKADNDADKGADNVPGQGGGQGADKGRTLSGLSGVSLSLYSDLSSEKIEDLERENAREGGQCPRTVRGQGADKGRTDGPDSPADSTPDTQVVRVAPVRRKSDKKPLPIPADWAPTPEHRAFAAKHDLDVEREAYGFRGYFDGQSVLSPNGRFATWLNNAADRRAQRGVGAKPPAKAEPAPLYYRPLPPAPPPFDRTGGAS